MKTDLTVNSVLNDIMAGDGAGVLLYAPKEYDKEDFLSELGTRYYKSYWFNGYVHDLHQPAICLIDNLLNDVPELQMRLKQLLFCHSRDNGPEVAIRAILEYLATMNRDVVIIFEKMELLPLNYDFSQYVYLIKHAPKNVKIICSSDSFLSMEISNFEPNFPMLIDETSLIKCADLMELDEYLMAISKENLAYLKFVSAYGVVSQAVAESVKGGGSELLETLAHRGIYVASRTINGVKCYCFKPELIEYLKGMEKELEEYSKEFKGGVCDVIYTSLYERGRYFEALNIAVHDRNEERMEGATRRLLDVNSISNAADYVAAHREFRFTRNIDIDKYPYIALLNVANLVKNAKRYEEALPMIEKIAKSMTALESEEGRRGYMCAIYIELICYIRLGDNEQYAIRMAQLGAECDGDEWKRRAFGILKVVLPEYVLYNDVDPSALEAMKEEENADKCFWYLKLLEEIEWCYYKSGNYARAMQTAREIQALCPCYVAPLRVIAMNFYEGDVAETERLAGKACVMEDKNANVHDYHLLYSVRALTAQYYGNYEEAKSLSDKAYSLISDQNIYFEKFFTVYVRCYIKAKNGETEYAKKLANLYLQYARDRAPECEEMMGQIYAYALYRSGDIDKAYRYAKAALAKAERKSFSWLYSMGMMTNFLMAKGELKDTDSIVANLLQHSASYSLEMVIADAADDIFTGILRYARENKIAPEVVADIDALIAHKRGGKDINGIQISLFGNVSISVCGNEIQWKTRKSKDLFLHYLIAGELGIDRNAIIDLMWRDYLYDSAINNLKTTNNIIRNTLHQNGVDFKLEYLNSRYSIKINNLTSDLDEYRALVRRFAAETDTTIRSNIMHEILNVYKADFAVDMNYADFEHERTGIKQEMVLNLVKLVRALAREKKYIDAKEFLTALTLIDKDGDYGHMVAELDKFINIT